ncbi:MAG: hypothetical protein ACK56I_23685, partial [bacterium]
MPTCIPCNSTRRSDGPRGSTDRRAAYCSAQLSPEDSQRVVAQDQAFLVVGQVGLIDAGPLHAAVVQRCVG